MGTCSTCTFTFFLAVAATRRRRLHSTSLHETLSTFNLSNAEAHTRRRRTWVIFENVRFKTKVQKTFFETGSEYFETDGNRASFIMERHIVWNRENRDDDVLLEFLKRILTKTPNRHRHQAHLSDHQNLITGGRTSHHQVCSVVGVSRLRVVVRDRKSREERESATSSSRLVAKPHATTQHRQVSLPNRELDC